jgi:hypothetical protein
MQLRYFIIWFLGKYITHAMFTNLISYLLLLVCNYNAERIKFEKNISYSMKITGGELKNWYRFF